MDASCRWWFGATAAQTTIFSFFTIPGFEQMRDIKVLDSPIGIKILGPEFVLGVKSAWCPPIQRQGSRQNHHATSNEGQKRGHFVS